MSSIAFSSENVAMSWNLKFSGQVQNFRKMSFWEWSGVASGASGEPGSLQKSVGAYPCTLPLHLSGAKHSPPAFPKSRWWTPKRFSWRLQPLKIQFCNGLFLGPGVSKRLKIISNIFLLLHFRRKTLRRHEIWNIWRKFQIFQKMTLHRIVAGAWGLLGRITGTSKEHPGTFSHTSVSFKWCEALSSSFSKISLVEGVFLKTATSEDPIL